MPNSSIYQPIAFTDFKVPGMFTGFPFSSVTIFPVTGLPSRFTRPASRTSNAIEFALRVDVVFKFTLYATKKSRAPITVEPDFTECSAGPKSGFHSGNFIFSVSRYLDTSTCGGHSIGGVVLINPPTADTRLARSFCGM